MPVSTKDTPFRNTIPRGICAGLFAAGFCLTFLSYLPGISPVWALLCGILAAAWQFLFLCKPFRKTALLALNGLALLVFLLFFRDCIRGAALFCNQVISRWNAVSQDAVSLLSDAMPRQIPFLLFTILLIAAWGTLLVRIHKPTLSFFTLLFLTLPSLLLQCFSPLGTGLYLTGWLLQRICYCEQSFSLKKVGWFLTAASVVLATAGAAPRTELQSLNTLRASLKTAVRHVRFGEDSLPKGDLSEAYRMNAGSGTTLIVSQTQAKDLYLRGYIGASYDNGTWSELTRGDFRGENDGMTDWLAAHGFTAAEEYTAYLKASGEGASRNQVTVENIGADRSFVYLPYSAGAPDCNTTVTRDAAVRSSGLFGTKQYHFTECAGYYPGELLYADDWVMEPKTKKQKAYTNYESIYRSFVYQNYLEIPRELQPLITREFRSNANPASENTIYAVTQHIHTVLESDANYSMLPERIADTEPIPAFLNGETGNSALYATAAVLAYRAFGIPARYVEGYYIDGTQVRNRVGTDLTPQDAHAWAEVYLDGMGWIPIDVTPGYYKDVYTLMKMVHQPQNTVKVTADSDEDTQSDSANTQSPHDAKENTAPKTAAHITVLLLGIAALLLILAAAWTAFLEIRATIRSVRIQKRYQHADTREQQDMLCVMIPRVLRCIGVETHIGWQAETAEKRIREKLPTVREGEFLRVNTLMEKYVYGESCLPPHEVRVLTAFLKKLSDPRQKSLSRKERFRIRQVSTRAGRIFPKQKKN